MFLRNCSKLLVTRNSGFAYQASTRSIKRWVAPTLRELNKRSKKLGPNAEITKRNTFVEWNYNSEVYAFGQRLQENFDITQLQRAFVHKSYITKEEIRQKELGVENPEIMLQSNETLIKTGQHLVFDYVTAFLEHFLPKVPRECIDAYTTYLTSVSMLANISQNLGTSDLILSANIDDYTLADTLFALIGALRVSSGDEKAYSFVRDFICTHLNQKDVLDIWEIADPIESLKTYCSENKLGTPEPRLIGESAKNTILAAFHVGVYSNKNLLGQGFGEDVQTAVKTASIEALRKFYGIGDNMSPFDYSINLEKKSSQKAKLHGAI